MSCVTACPSGVKYDRLIEATRPHIERQGTRPVGDRLFRRLLFSLLPYPDRLRWLTRPLELYQRSGLQGIARRSGMLNLLPRRVAALERLAPRMGRRSPDLPSVVPAAPANGPTRCRVGLLLGCVQRVFFSEVNAATARVLAAEGCEVHIPPDQGCCGALMLHAGLDAEAADAARLLIDRFQAANVDRIVINAAGCGSAMKQYGELLRDDPNYAARARAFAAQCVDVSELVTELEPRSPRHPMPLRLAYHDACHLQHAQRIRQQPRLILQAIPSLELHEIAEGDICCGSAGVYNLLEPDAAEALGDRKVKNVIETNADLLVSANPGCLLQIASGLARAGRPMRAMHFIEVVDASIRGEKSSGLLRR
jgi:glycolate oxidase iron-sulfur subunit